MLNINHEHLYVIVGLYHQVYTAIQQYFLFDDNHDYFFIIF